MHSYTQDSTRHSENKSVSFDRTYFVFTFFVIINNKKEMELDNVLFNET